MLEPMDVDQPGPSNALTERIQELKVNLTTLHKFSERCDIKGVYRLKPYWSDRDPKELIVIFNNLIIEAPAARRSLLHLIGVVVHESVQIYFLEREGTPRKQTSGTFEAAVRVIIGNLSSLADEMRLTSFSMEILEWLFELFATIAEQNGGRRGIAGQKNATSLLENFSRCPVIADLIRLLDNCFTFLLSTDASESIAKLIDASRHGKFFDWIWLHVANTFPSEVVPDLMRIGIVEFETHCKLVLNQQNNPAMVATLQTEYYECKLRPFCDFFNYLARKRNTELKAIMLRILNEFFDTTTPNGILFLIRLLVTSPDIGQFLMDDMVKFASKRNILKLIELKAHPVLPLSLPPKGINDFLASFIQTDLSRGTLHPNTLLSLLDGLVPIAMDDQVLRGNTLLAPAQQNDVRQGVANLIDLILSSAIAAVHYDRKVRLQDYPYLLRLAEDEELKQVTAESALLGDRRGQFNAKLVNTASMLAGQQLAVDYLARMVAGASDEKQLANVCAFVTTLTPYYPHVLTTAVKLLLATLGDYDGKPPRFIRNLLYLIQWQRSAADSDDVKYLGLSLADLRGEFQERLLDWGLEYVRKLHTTLDRASADVMVSLFQLLLMSSPRTQLRMKDSSRLLMLFSAMVVALLKLVKKETFGSPLDGVDIIGQCMQVIGQFFTYQTAMDMTLLISALFNEVVKNASDLFGTPKEMCVTEGEIDFDGIPPILLRENTSERAPDEHSFLKELRAMSFGPKRPVQMAHSGMISRRHQKPKSAKITETECLRSLLFVNMIEKMCSQGAAKDSYNVELCKQLGTLITESVCVDGITACFRWDAWEVEKETVPRYLEVSKRLEAMPFLYNFLAMIAECGLIGLCFILPVLKSVTATVLVHHESTPLKDEKLNDAQLARLAQIFSLLIKANLAPATLSVCYEICRSVTNHEVSVILLEIWRFIQATIPMTPEEVARLTEGPAMQLEQKAREAPLRAMMIVIIQRNIRELAHLMPGMIDGHAVQSTAVDENAGWEEAQ